MPLPMPSTTYLCDTNVVSELARQRPNPGVNAWAARVEVTALSVVSVEEVLFGLAWKPNARVRAWFEAFLEQHCQILPITPEIAKRSGQLRGQLRGEGHTRSQADMLIAATAEIHQLTLVTRNARDFQGCRIPLLDPFQ